MKSGIRTATPAAACPAAGLLAALVALVLALGASCAAPSAAWAADDDIASGTSGSCDWVIDAEGTLTISPSDGESGTLESSPWCDYSESITAAVIEDGVCIDDYSNRLFYDCEELESVEGLDNLDVSEATGMSYMFYNCSSLQTIDVSEWDTSEVLDMAYMFYNCSSLQTLDVSGWDTSSVFGYQSSSCMASMFEGCSSLTYLDVSDWDVSSVVSMDHMFSGCSSLESLDVSDWNVKSVWTVYFMFYNCSSLQTLDVSGWNTTGMRYFTSMFEGCSSLGSLDVSGWDTSDAEGTTDMFNGCSSLETLDVSGWDTSDVTGMNRMFYGCTSLAELDTSGWETPFLEGGLTSMFYDCSSLTELDLSSLDVSKVTGMSSMFEGCSSLETLDISGWDTSSATGMSSMFYDCSALKFVDTSGWDTSGVTGMNRMFYNCSSLESLDVSGWDTSSVEGYMSNMFYDCSSLTELDVSGWDISGVTGLSYMFEGCSSLESLDVSAWDTSNVTGMNRVFFGCSSLTELDLSSWDTSYVQYMSRMFYGCSGLRTFTVGDGFAFSATNPNTNGVTTSELPTPIEDGVEGWWVNEATGVAYEDPGDIPSNTAATYVAVFPEASEDSSSTQSSYNFTDVQDESLYFFDAVYALADAGIITGVSDTLYGVGQNMTRAQFATIVWRIAGKPATSYDAGYSDVKDGQYYTEAINWAAKEGVVTGYTSGSYGINDVLSFQDMCLIIARYANGGNSALQAAVSDDEAASILADFADSDSVAAYADNGMAWCVTEGLVAGKTDGTIVPQENVTRQRAAVVVARWQGLAD